MAKPSRFGSAVSFAVLASLFAGARPRAAACQRLELRRQGGRAMSALRPGRWPRSIPTTCRSRSIFAERAVARTPERRRLPRACSAMPISPAAASPRPRRPTRIRWRSIANQPQVILKLALVEIAQGKTAKRSRSSTPAAACSIAADYGLALALAGRTDERHLRARSRRPRARAPTPASAKTSRSPMRLPATGPRRAPSPPRTSPPTSSTPASSNGCSSPSRRTRPTRSPR